MCHSSMVEAGKKSSFYDADEPKLGEKGPVGAGQGHDKSLNKIYYFYHAEEIQAQR